MRGVGASGVIDGPVHSKPGMLHRNMTIHRALTKSRFRPEALFRPDSVAVIGAGGKAGMQVMANLLTGGFKGAVLPVGAGLGSVSGVLAYDDIAALPVVPDLAVLCDDDGGDAAEVFAGLAQRGTYAAVVIGMMDGVAAAARQTGVRALGPGSFGMSVPSIGLQAVRSHLLAGVGRVALVSQSAALCRAVLDWAEPNGVGFSHVVGLGGNTDIGFATVLDWLSRDPGTGAILLDIRQIRDRRVFLSGARAASRLRPVVAMRAGGLLLDPSGAADAAFEAALRRAGVLVVDCLEDMLAAAETLTRARPARGEGLAIVTNAIGPAQMAADAALRCGMQLAQLSTETRAVLRLAVPRAFGEASRVLGAGHAGDLVYVGVGEPIKLAEAAAMLSGAREVGGVLVVQAPTGEADGAGIAALAAAASGTAVPLLVCAMGETTGLAHRRLLASAGVPVFATPEQAVRGFRHLVQDRRNRAAARELPADAVLALAPDQAAVRSAFARARAEGRLQLDDNEALAVFAAYGIIGAELDGRFVRLREDATFGPVIAFGVAGTAEHAVDLPPLNLPLAHALIAHSKVPGLLPAAEAALADLLVRVSQLAVDFPELAEIDVAAPVMIRLRAADAPPGRLALPPYPAELSGQYDARGEMVQIRPIRPEDAEAHGAFFARLSPEDIRFRFFSVMREMSPEQMARMTQVDYEREMAFVAGRTKHGRWETVGVARLVREGRGPGAGRGEFAVVVQPDMKGRGLARHLMGRLIDWGRAQGLETIVGEVLAENGPMLGFMRSLGFEIRRQPDDPHVVEAVMVL